MPLTSRYRITRRALLTIAVGITAALSLPAEAQLYAREAPPNSAFIRAFNNTANTGVGVKIGEQTEPPLLSYAASAYIFREPGAVSIKVGPHEKTVMLEANHFYTAVETSNGLVMFELSGVLNRLKSMIAIFNLMPTTAVGLKTADGKATVFESVAPGTSAQREINPLKLTLGLFNGPTKLTDVPAVALDRGKVFSLFVSGSEAYPVMIWNED